MGLVKILFDSIKQTFSEQWIDYFKCDSIPADVLVARGRRFAYGGNAGTDENVISDGSRVDVADGQFMIIVENGKVVDYCAEPGQYLYKTGTKPSLFNGIFTNLGSVAKESGRKFTAGGQRLSDQRVYYVNLKEVMGNKWGVGNVAFRDSEFDFSMKISAYGEYTYKITNPLAFYKSVSGNLKGDFYKSAVEPMLKAELQTALQTALGRVALKGIPYDKLPLYTTEVCDALNAELRQKWSERRGISLYSIAIASVAPDDESAQKIAEFQESRVYGRNAGMMGAKLGLAKAEAMQNAASNSGGAMLGFMGMGMANGAAGNSVENMYAMGSAKAPQNSGGSWTCTCGRTSDGNFCPDCGKRRPSGWACPDCGYTSGGARPNFCPNCGKNLKGGNN